MTPTSSYLNSLQSSLTQGLSTEHTHRPALKTLIEDLFPDYTATNEPSHIACGAPDFVVSKKIGNETIPVGYIEAKDIGKPLSQVQRSEQMKRYLASLENLILTDYLEFRWYVDGDLRRQASFANLQPDGKLKRTRDGAKAVTELLSDFVSHAPQQVTSPAELARRMARLTHIVRDIIITAFETGEPSNLLQGWRDAFAKVLIADLNQPEKTPEFADMFAQTLAYGLFTARIMDTTPGDFSRSEAQHLIPKSNPFLRDFFIQISGPQLDDEPFAPFVNDLVNLLAYTDMESVLAEFGRRTRQEDPIVHFYETFLAAYDPKLRESRGVYYTPEPVVSYIVRSVDPLLKTRFDCPDGLADTTKVTIPNYDPSLKVKGKKDTRKTTVCHKVLILDPACGTGTFLYSVIDHIREGFMQRGDAGMWPGYVKNQLLPRLFGFELLMAPYAIAHFKLSLQLAGRDLPEEQRERWAYHPEEDERLGIYLTNTLEEPHEMTGLPLFTQWVANETNAANEVKRNLPVFVVMGNPPYSGHSTNKGEWIDGLLKGKSLDGAKISNYYEVDGEPLGERNPKWLQDDYVKFIRFGQWRINRSKQGILAFISNHGYLDNPTFRGMRYQLLESFSEIFIYNLHGNKKRREVTPDGDPDNNVFDIQQGVTIGIFVLGPGKRGPAKVYYSDLWGDRESKYESLLNNTIKKTQWQQLEPQPPYYLFINQNIDLLGEYQSGWSVKDIFPVNSSGIVTARDNLTIHSTEESVLNTVRDFAFLSSEDARRKYDLRRDVQDWKVDWAQEDVRLSGPLQKNVVPILYRPFDIRYTYFTGRSRGFICRPRKNVMRHMLTGKNIGLVTTRQVTNLDFCNILCTRYIIELKVASHDRNTNLFPLYLNPDNSQDYLSDIFISDNDNINRKYKANINPVFVSLFSQGLGLLRLSNGFGDLKESLGPEDLFAYIYSILHSREYRIRYAEFLKIDFPRIPITSNIDQFRGLCQLGSQLVALHLLESPDVFQFITSYPVPGEDHVERGYPKYVPPGNGQGGRIQINKDQFFEGVPEDVWEFHIGGYQVLHKWLKDRRSRQLSYDDLTHYQKIVVSLSQTIRVMSQIDQTIDTHGGWPIA